MTELVLPLLTLTAAAALTYLFCIRPMRTRHGCGSGASDPRDINAEILAAREELERLRANQTPSPANTGSLRR